MVDNSAAHDLLSEVSIGMLATLRADGRPHLSPVTQHYDRDAGKILVSIREGLVKTRNIRRDPRVSIAVTRADGYAWATAEGTAELHGPSTDPHSPAIDALVEYYRAAAGEHPDWDDYRAAMIRDQRVLLAIDVDRVYGRILA